MGANRKKELNATALQQLCNIWHHTPKSKRKKLLRVNYFNGAERHGSIGYVIHFSSQGENLKHITFSA